ncbi:MAG TPA: hypothetical protein EYO42_02055 [Candidatus Poseidoniales archaeon]|nr:hypothetical protein [Candidatus Poseidoniales archaeon]
MILLKLLIKSVLNKGRKEWPTVSTRSGIEYFLSRLSCRYQIGPISVSIRSKIWIREWTNNPKAIACAWREDREMFAAFADSLVTPLHPKCLFLRSWKERNFLRAIIHEFVHLYLRTKHPHIVESHSPEFIAMELDLAREYGIFI